MKPDRIALLLALYSLLVILLPPAVQAGPVPVIALLDQQQRPVPDAVITLPGAVPATPRPAARTAIMDQKDLQFDPRVLIVEPGTEVHFPNSDDTRHHVYSFSEAKVFELPLYSAADSPAVKFDNSGIVKLGCNIHDDMRGYIYIAAHPVYGLSNGEGRVTLPDIAGELPRQLIVWHPQLADRLTIEFDRLSSDVSSGGNAAVLTLTLPFILPSEESERKSNLKRRLKRYKSGR